MPKIKNLKIYVGREQVSFQINFKTRESIFECRIPSFIEGVTSADFLFGKTLDEVERKIKSCVAEYLERVKTKKKVILYYSKIYEWELIEDGCTGIQASGSDIVSQRIRDYQLRGESIQEVERLNLDFGYKLAIETSHGDQKTYSDENGHRIYHTQEYKVIEWTERREEFFKSVRNGIVNIIIRLSDFLGQDLKTLILAVDSGKIKLLTND